MESFRIQYEWRGESVPPPYYFEYSIRLGPGREGEIVFQPDYSWNEPPVWRYSLDVSEDELAELHALVLAQKVFDREWRQDDALSVGGRTERVEGSDGSSEFSVPDALVPEDAQLVASIYRAIRAFVPEWVWVQLRQQHEEYKRTYLQRQQ